MKVKNGESTHNSWLPVTNDMASDLEAWHRLGFFLSVRPSGLRIPTGLLANNSFVDHHISTQQMLLDPPVRSETMLFFRLSMFQQFLDAPQDQVCKCFIHESDHSNGPEVRGGSCVFRFLEASGTLFYSKTMVFPPYAKFGS